MECVLREWSPARPVLQRRLRNGLRFLIIVIKLRHNRLFNVRLVLRSQIHYVHVLVEKRDYRQVKN